MKMEIKLMVVNQKGTHVKAKHLTLKLATKSSKNKK